MTDLATGRFPGIRPRHVRYRRPVPRSPAHPCRERPSETLAPGVRSVNKLRARQADLRNPPNEQWSRIKRAMVKSCGSGNAGSGSGGFLTTRTPFSNLAPPRTSMTRWEAFTCPARRLRVDDATGRRDRWQALPTDWRSATPEPSPGQVRGRRTGRREGEGIHAMAKMSHLRALSRAKKRAQSSLYGKNESSDRPRHTPNIPPVHPPTSPPIRTGNHRAYPPRSITYCPRHRSRHRDGRPRQRLFPPLAGGRYRAIGGRYASRCPFSGWRRVRFAGRGGAGCPAAGAG